MRRPASRRDRLGDVDVEPGDYDVAVDEETWTIILPRDGAEVLRAEALARSSKAMVRKPKVELRAVAGQSRRLLVVRTSPAAERVLSLDERS